MLDFGFSEIVLTSAIALIVLGPEKLPKVARQVGNWMGRARAMARQLTDQLEREVNADDLMKQTRKAASATHAGATQVGATQVMGAAQGDAARAASVQTDSLSGAPVSFDTSHMSPTMAAEEAAAATPPAAYPPQTASPPHGADWHPSATENKTSDG